MSERKRFTKLRALYQIWFMCIYTLPNNRLVLNNNIDSHNIIKDWHTSDRHIVFKRYTETQHLKLKKRHTLLIQIAYKTLRANINIYMYQFVLLNLPLDAKCGCYTLYMIYETLSSKTDFFFQNVIKTRKSLVLLSRISFSNLFKMFLLGWIFLSHVPSWIFLSHFVSKFWIMNIHS